MALVCACHQAPDACDHIDAQWHRQDLVHANLAHWLAHAPTPNGYFHTAFARDWTPLPAAGVDLTAQARLVYTMVRGFEVTGDRDYLSAATAGGDFILEHFPDLQHPGWFDRVDPQGRVIDKKKRTYSHAFLILAMAHLYHSTRDPRYREAALTTWDWLRNHLRDEAGGFPPEATLAFTPAESLRTQNPVMHLFEAMLALWEFTRNPEALAGALEIGDFVIGRLLIHQGQAAYIPEWYSTDWHPLPKDEGGYIDLGHQFEWAYLLSTATRLGLPDAYAETGEAVLRYAMQEGYDAQQGGCFNRLRPEGGKDLGKGWWQQSEALRTLMHYATVRGQTDRWTPYRETLSLIQREFADTKNGGWYPSPVSQCPDTPCTLPQAGYGYHVTAMHMEALALTQECPPP